MSLKNRIYFKYVQLKDWLLFKNMTLRLTSYRVRMWWESIIASFLDKLDYIQGLEVVIVLGQELDNTDSSTAAEHGNDTSEVKK